MMLETANAADDHRHRGILGDYHVSEIVDGELFEITLSRPGHGVKIIGYAYSEREVVDKIREYDLA